MPPERKILIGVGAIVQHPITRDLLMLRRGDGGGRFSSEGAGTWAVPGGWIDFGETAMQAVSREVMEETSIVVVAQKELRSTMTFTDDEEFHIHTQFIKCKYILGEPTVTEPTKCQEVQWVKISKIWSLPLFKPFAAFWKGLEIS